MFDLVTQDELDRRDVAIALRDYLEVRLGDGNELVGWLTSVRCPCERSNVVFFQPGMSSVDVDTVQIKFVRYRVDITRDERSPQIQAPPYARVVELLFTRQIEYSWRVLAPTLEQFEWIFDLDSFEPA